MLSDVLFEAIEKMHAYQQQYPQVYDDLEKEINLVSAGMDWLRHRLDQCQTETAPAYEHEEGGHGLDEQLPDDHRDSGRTGETGETIEKSETTLSVGEVDQNQPA